MTKCPVLYAVALALVFSTSTDATPASSQDLCPELARTADNPDGNRDCGPGCMPESEFGLKKALTALDELDRALLAAIGGIPSADEWEAAIQHAGNLVILRGTLLQMQLEIARPAGAANYEAARLQYCDFLRDGARYLD